MIHQTRKEENVVHFPHKKDWEDAKAEDNINTTMIKNRGLIVYG